jgi:diaminopimelate epimerase
MQRHRLFSVVPQLSRLLRFTKMNGLGNDFVVVDATRAPVVLSAAQIRRLADRRFGVGCDQVLLVEPARSSAMDFYYRIFNADGGEVENCGNGARCFARFVHDKGLCQHAEIRVGTLAGIIVPRILDDGRVSVDMGIPEFEPAKIPFVAECRALDYSLNVAGENRTIIALAMGNPHAVQVVADVERAPLAYEGPLIERHERFPQRVNAGYMQVVNRHAIKLRVFERGAGETLACGTGACAAVVAGVARGLLDSPVGVSTRGGELEVAWAGEGTSVIMCGPATSVFEGEIEI